jgi:hypothetical protein
MNRAVAGIGALISPGCDSLTVLMAYAGASARIHLGHPRHWSRSSRR